jgi:hypothetical protein
MSEEEENVLPINNNDSFYSRHEDIIILTMISWIALLIFWVLDRVFYCFRKVPPHATINPRRVVPTVQEEVFKHINKTYTNKGSNARVL